MAHDQHDNEPGKTLKLPIMVSSPVEVGRLIREIAEIDEALLQLGLREGGSNTKMPQTSRLMDQIIGMNDLNLLHQEDRKLLQDYLVAIRKKAPVIHMSFSADPSAEFIEKLMSWLRQEIDPDVLLTIGLQPNLGAGSILRTTNRYFDLSLKKNFDKKRGLLKDMIRKAQETAA